MGLDSDDPLAGRGRPEGVAIDTVDDMEVLFRGIDTRQRVRLDDDQRPAAMIWPSTLRRGRPGPWLRWRSCAARSRTTSSRSFTRRTSSIFPPEPSVRLVIDVIEFCTRKCRSGTPCRSPATTSARPARLRRRSWPSRWQMASRTSRRRSRAASRSTSSHRGCRSSSTRTSTSSKRSRSTGRRGGFGRASCATASGQGIRAAS